VGSRAAKRLQPGDLFIFTSPGIAYRQVTHPSDVPFWEHAIQPPNTCGIVMARPSREETFEVELALGDGGEDDDDMKDDWMPCLIAGERLWICGLERTTKRLNRRSP
jgi:hypothetical protein